MILVFFSCALLCGCATAKRFSCPYEITSSKVIEKEAVLHVVNLQDIAFSHITFSFLIYDGDGSNPCLGSNCVVCSFEQRLDVGEMGEFRIPLDEYLVDAAMEDTSELFIKYVYVQEIRYIDKKVWRDSFGMFALQDECE